METPTSTSTDVGVPSQLVITRKADGFRFTLMGSPGTMESFKLSEWDVQTLNLYDFISGLKVTNDV